MAITTSNVLQTAVSSYFSGLVQPSDSWSKIYNVDRSDVPSRRLAALTGIPDPGAWDGAADLPTTTLDSTGAVTMSYQAYGVQVRLPYLAANGDIPGVVEMASRKLGRSVASKRAALAWAHLETSFTAGPTAIADGLALCSAVHTTAGAATRSNLAANTALDRSAFLAMIGQMRRWVNFQGQTYDLADAKKYLVVPPELETAARQIVGSPFALTTPVTSGGPAQGEINTAGGFNTEVIVSSYLADTNDYWLICDPAVESPLHWWDRAMPAFDVYLDQDSKAVKLNASWACATASGPQPDGIIGCNKT